MPNIKSQKKRVLTNKKSNDINKAKKSRVKTAMKKFDNAIANNDAATAELLYNDTIGIIEAARVDGIYHRNNASRKISNVTKKLNNLKEAK